MLSSFPTIQFNPGEEDKNTLKYSGNPGIEFDEIVVYDIILLQKKTFQPGDLTHAV